MAGPQYIMIKFTGTAQDKSDLEKAFLTLLRHAEIPDIKTLATAVERKPGLIKSAVKFV